MFRARSSLYLINLISWWLFGSGLVFLNSVLTPNNLSHDVWRERASYVANLQGWGIGLTALAGISAATIAIMELCLYRGWEPKFLEVLKPGCEILQMTPALDGSRATVMVRLANGAIDTYEADSDEMREIQLGSVSHLWVIGKYISRIRVITPNLNVAPASRAERLAILPQSLSLGSGIPLLVFLVGSCFATGTGLLLAITREAQTTSNGTRRHPTPPITQHFEGTNVALGGVGLIVLGLSIVMVLFFYLRIGWDDAARDEYRVYRWEQSLLERWWFR